MKAMGVPETDATQYLPYGCGEYILWHRSLGTPSGALNVAKCLELALNDGCCLLTGRQLGPRTGEAAGLNTFDNVWRAFTEQLDQGIRALAHFQRVEYEVGAREAPFLFFTLLMDDCLASGRAVAEGVRYLGGTLEAYGNIDAADALVSLRKSVFEERIVSLPELVDALRRNWNGAEKLREHMLALPKFGNDDREADDLAERVHHHLATAIRGKAREVGLHHYLMVVINNSMNVNLGTLTAALPDGRLAREPLANGINPVAGRDRQGVTAFLHSLVRLKPDRHAGAVQNMKFSRGMFTRTRAKLEALLHTYWSSGGAQAMLTVVSRGDLEAALREPEKWGHLMVRVGGFSARFVELPRDVQLHILARTLHE
jgi:pyruvate-formate lyase